MPTGSVLPDASTSRPGSVEDAAQQAVEDRRPHLVVTVTAYLSPVVKYHGLARRHLLPPRFLMRPLLNGGTLGGRAWFSLVQKQCDSRGAY
jgi:hypothetical protein